MSKKSLKQKKINIVHGMNPALDLQCKRCICS